MIVEVKVVGRPNEVVDREFAGICGEVTLRALLSALVRVEIAGYESRRQAQQVLSVLTPGDLAAGHNSGRFVSGGRHARPAPAPEEAVDRALEAFTDGLYLVVFDGEQITELDARVVVAPSSRLRLIRLVALAGG